MGDRLGTPGAVSFFVLHFTVGFDIGIYVETFLFDMRRVKSIFLMPNHVSSQISGRKLLIKPIFLAFLAFCKVIH